MSSITTKFVYTTRKQQDVYESLPEAEKSALYAYYWEIAHRINSLMNRPETIEIAGMTILSLPFGFGAPPERFYKEGGLINPSLRVATADKNQDKMMCWVVDFEDETGIIDGIPYKGFNLWKQVYKAFPKYKNMTKKEAEKAGLYPTIYYYNYAGWEWMAANHWGHLATLDEDYSGELRILWDATKRKGITNLERLAMIGQAPLDFQDAEDARAYGLGNCACLASGSLNEYGNVRSLLVHRDSGIYEGNFWQRDNNMSFVVVLDNVPK